MCHWTENFNNKAQIGSDPSVTLLLTYLALFEEALAISAKYSIIKIDAEKHTVSLHRLLQEVIQLKGQKHLNPLNQACTLLQQTFPDGVHLEDYRKMISLIPHLEAVQGHIIRKGDLDDASTLLSLLHKLTEGYRVLGRHCSRHCWRQV